SLAAISLFASTVLGAYVPGTDVSAWTTLTPTGSAPPGAVTDYTVTFGIYTSELPTNTIEKRAVSQIDDGQVQAPTTTVAVVSQIGDGQIQAPRCDVVTITTSAVTVVVTDSANCKVTVPAVSQIGDGQIQAPTGHVAVVSQIGDGQIQAPTGHVAVVSQIGDGQIQAPTGVAVVSQIGDGQIQAPTHTVPAVSQIGDGQIQAPTTLVKVVSQINDGQVQATSAADSSTRSFGDGLYTCDGEGVLSMTLKDGILTDSHGRIGSIVANRQFQFDGPPQAGCIYAKGWSIQTNGTLTLGDNSVFYKCRSGSFYNLYDQDIGSECIPIQFLVADVIKC
ncbi:hypothetical protein CANCADRAFT_20614, partial [Tortispora caseinolytica NRRL Y-17796]